MRGGPLGHASGRWLRRPGVFVARERLEKPVDLLRLLLLLFDEGAEVVDRPPRVLGRDASAVAVVTAPAGGDQVRGLPEELRRLRGGDQVMDARRVAAAAWPWNAAGMPVAGEHGGGIGGGLSGCLRGARRIGSIMRLSADRRYAVDPLAVGVLVAGKPGGQRVDLLLLLPDQRVQLLDPFA